MLSQGLGDRDVLNIFFHLDSRFFLPLTLAHEDLCALKPERKFHHYSRFFVKMNDYVKLNLYAIKKISMTSQGVFLLAD